MPPLRESCLPASCLLLESCPLLDASCMVACKLPAAAWELHGSCMRAPCPQPTHCCLQVAYCYCCLPANCLQAARELLTAACKLPSCKLPLPACCPMPQAAPCPTPPAPLLSSQQLVTTEPNKERKRQEDVSSQEFPYLPIKYIVMARRNYFSTQCGFGLAVTAASCNHLQPLECMGEIG